MTQQYDLFLVLRQFIDEGPYIIHDLILDEHVFDVLFRQFLGVKNVRFIIFLQTGIQLLFFPEMIDDQVMCNPDYPRYELAIVPVFTCMKGFDDLNKGILEYVFGKLLVFNQKADVCEDLVFVTVDQDLNTRTVSIDETFDKFLIAMVYRFQNYLLSVIIQGRS